MSEAHIKRSYLDATEINGRLIGKHHSWWGILVASHHVVPGILVSNYLGEIDVLDVSTGVVAMTASMTSRDSSASSGFGCAVLFTLLMGFPLATAHA